MRSSSVLKKEEGFGHLIMFGLGGIFTEVLKDNIFALAPLGLKESESISTQHTLN